MTYQVTVSPTATGTLTTTASVNEPADMNALNNTATQAVRVGLATFPVRSSFPRMRLRARW